MDPQVARRLEWAERTALEVGRLLMGRFRTGLESTDKAVGIVTELDRQAEDLIAQSLRQAFPDDSLLSEEGAGRTGSNEWRWIVDPLDGTTNYVSGLTHFSTSLACMRHGRVELGVVHNPATAETFKSTLGGGASGPEGTLRPRKTARIQDAVFLLNKCYLPPDRLWEVCGPLLGELRAFRYLGCISLDLIYVAAGRVDGLILLPSEPWDIAAGVAMLRESGASVFDLSGQPPPEGERSGIIAAPAQLMDEVMARVRLPE